MERNKVSLYVGRKFKNGTKEHMKGVYRYEK